MGLSWTGPYRSAVPNPGAGKVLVRVRAAGVNNTDINIQCQGSERKGSALSWSQAPEGIRADACRRWRLRRASRGSRSHRLPPSLQTKEVLSAGPGVLHRTA